MAKPWKEEKKAYKRAKRRLVTPWKTLGILFLVLTLILAPVSVVLDMFDNTVSAYFGGSFWELENRDDSAVYYASDFASVDELAAYGRQIAQTVEAEGAALLRNDNGALPLAEGSKVSCFSTSSVNLVYGGTGSGNIDASKADSLKTALEKAGLTVNSTLWDFYKTGAGSKYARKGGTGVMSASATVSEAPWSAYPQNVLDSMADYGDAAIVVFSRVGGEGSDMEFQSTNYLALNAEERELLQHLSDQKASGSLGSIIVLLNTANALQLDFIDDYGIDAILWVGDVGITGVNAAAEILTGKVNPSGSLADTYCRDNFSAPAMRNFVPVTYQGYDGKSVPGNASTYMVYQEGIYVGYRYYETRYEDFVTGSGNPGDYAYAKDVAYPFGFGLSYTTFDWSELSGSYDKASDSFTFCITVTNTGSMPGKDTVQLYLRSPYTDYDRANGVEKSAVSLCGFGKTELLNPGQSQELTVTVPRRELASYDSTGAGTYILDAGDYYIIAAGDAHSAVNNGLAALGFTPENTQGRMDAAGREDLTFLWNEETFDSTTYSTTKDGAPITNRLSCADPNLYGGVEESVTWLSRQDWTGTYPQQAPKLTLTDTLKRALQDVQYDPAAYEPVPMPTMGAQNGMKFYEMIGASYDDPRWETLLDQMTFEEMVALIGDSFHWRMPVKSLEAPGARDENGPQGLTASLLASDSTQLDATAFTSEDVMAATFNPELMYEVGRVIGNDCLSAGISSLYGPGNNTHRTPYGGRNFEYYSEDGFLSGTLSAEEVRGIREKGVDVMMKHYALNDCEQDRIGLGVWINEQAAREIYLKAFQAPAEAGAGVMAAYTRWGAIWSGGLKGLMTDILRGEWGIQGMTITDNVLTTYVNGVDGILAGITTFDAMLPYVLNQLPDYRNDPVIVTAMRQACHRTLYSLANSVGVNGLGENTTIRLTRAPIFTVLKAAAAVCAILTIAAIAMWLCGTRKLKKTDAYIQYRAARKAGKK